MVGDVFPVGLEADEVGVVQGDARVPAQLCLFKKQGGDRSALEVEVPIEPGALKAGDVLELGQAIEGILPKFGSGEVGGIGKAGQIEDGFLCKNSFAKGGEAREFGQAELRWTGEDGFREAGGVEAGLEEVGPVRKRGRRIVQCSGKIHIREESFLVEFSPGEVCV